MSSLKNNIRTHLLIITNQEIVTLSKRKYSISNSDFSNDYQIEIKLQDQFYLPEKNSQAYKQSPLSTNKKNRNFIENKMNRHDSNQSKSQGIIKLISSLNPASINDVEDHEMEKNDNFSKKDNYSQETLKKISTSMVKDFNKIPGELAEGSLMQVYSQFVGCLDSKISIGFEKHLYFNDKLNNRKTKPRQSQTINKRYSIKSENKQESISHEFENNNECRIDNILNYLNRESKNSNYEIAKKRRVKEGIFYIQSLVYCLRKNIENLKKSKKNHEEFNDFKKELLSPIIKTKKSKLNFEVLKKVYIWKEDKKLHEENKTIKTKFERKRSKMKTSQNFKLPTKRKESVVQKNKVSLKERKTIFFVDKNESLNESDTKYNHSNEILVDLDTKSNRDKGSKNSIAQRLQKRLSRSLIMNVSFSSSCNSVTSNSVISNADVGNISELSNVSGVSDINE